MPKVGMKQRTCEDCPAQFTPTNGKQRVCTDCRKTRRAAYEKQWRSDNKDKNAGYLRKYRNANKEKVREAQKQRDAQPKRKAEKLAAQLRYRQRHAELHRERNKQWRKKNREKTNEINRRGYLQRRNVPGKHTVEEWQALKEHHAFRCVCCRRQEPKITLTRDHIKPITLGGSDDIDNIQPLCGDCNSKKWAREIKYV